MIPCNDYSVTRAEWPASGIIPPTEKKTQYVMDYDKSTLPADGFPRITSEGVEILKEGLRGDFSRWRWSIGNHPLEMPAEHVRNLIIRTMSDRPHFYAEFWFGPRFPVTKRNRVLAPYVVFD